MTSLVSFIVLTASMGVGTLVCGLIPLSLPLSRRALRILEVFSAGLLIGAAVTVVVPEGAKTLFNSDKKAASASRSLVFPKDGLPIHAETAPVAVLDRVAASSDVSDWAWSFVSKRQATDEPHGHEHEGSEGSGDHHHHDDHHQSAGADSSEHLLGTSIICGFLLMFVIDQAAASAPAHHDHEHTLHSHAQTPAPTPSRRPEAHRLSRSFQQRRLQLFAQVAEEQAAGPNRAAVTLDDNAEPRRQDHHDDWPPHRAHGRDSRSSSSDLDYLPDDYDDDRHVGSPTAVSSKFDERGWSAASPTPAGASLVRADSSAPLLSPAPPKRRRGSHASAHSARSSPSTSSAAVPRDSFRQMLTTLVGLLIHAFADGIAMGASAGSGDSSLTLIVFFAIMVHKAPASFGLCTLLISQRLSRADIRKGVALFSLAAPLGAVTTYVLISLLFGGSTGGGIDSKHIGIALLFSGGTFLFVAMHAVLELAGPDADLEPVSDGTGDTEAQRNGTDDAVVEREVLGKLVRMGLVILGAWTPRLLQKVAAGLGGGHHH
ncbi:uncharacterized protein PFL1_03375 [Pseudozyma flocculosa PF-1]|uniref:Related to ATX2 - Golgi membrane protein involved in manganese homeostasis n=2 Tax=Pseudozyma flocculosa TaxID=84751 RepID=A0A5C3F7C4_9BASI|nr:uncharacterized protein PFL1_03375 [Pseudozyma flocculosa PF-1]EPQ29086.1 hypothetical protein PFL1_03375 [Pseudozyma flocculosa PF-1]SPO40080.1 related to ATX2 - Golgi membrane protein involved in manganese homeostasis [Pseudozyma flocculosa]